jgi:hypothetical protein
MTNRQRVISATQYAMRRSKLLRDEIGYYLDTYSETPGYDVADALNDCLGFAEANDERGLARVCIDVLIESGLYEPRTEEVVIMGRDRSPVRKGQRYDCVAAWCEWIER